MDPSPLADRDPCVLFGTGIFNKVHGELLCLQLLKSQQRPQDDGGGVCFWKFDRDYCDIQPGQRSGYLEEMGDREEDGTER